MNNVQQQHRGLTSTPRAFNTWTQLLAHNRKTLCINTKRSWYWSHNSFLDALKFRSWEIAKKRSIIGLLKKGIAQSAWQHSDGPIACLDIGFHAQLPFVRTRVLHFWTSLSVMLVHLGMSACMFWQLWKHVALRASHVGKALSMSGHQSFRLNMSIDMFGHYREHILPGSFMSEHHCPCSDICCHTCLLE